MARRDDCVAFGEKYGLDVITIDTLVEYIQKQQYSEKTKDIST